MGPAAAERSLGDGGVAATRPEAPRAGKPGGPGTQRGPGTAGTPPTPQGEPSLRATSRPRSPPVFPVSVATVTTRRVVLGGPSSGPMRLCLMSPPFASPQLPHSGCFARVTTGLFQPVPAWMSTLGRAPAPSLPTLPPVGSSFLW